MTQTIWVDSAETLETAVRHWCEEPFVALDTEFVRESTYFAELGLIQVATARACWLIDPLPIQGLADCLRPLLVSPDTLKVLHAADEDLEIFAGLLGEPVFPVLDTQVAVAMLGGAEKISYAGLVAERLGLDLAKTQTRSNWLARPLTAEQCEYAALDVIYLARLYPVIAGELEERQRVAWVLEDMARVARRNLEKRDAEAYLQLRQGWRLTGNRLWLLQQLAADRERIARLSNRVRRRLVSDQDLVQIATRRPSDRAGLQQVVTDMKPAAIRRECDWILQRVRASHTVPASRYPAPVPGPLSRALQPVFRMLRDRVRAVAGELGIPPTLLARKRDLEAFVEALSQGMPPETDWPVAWRGWRHRHLAALLQDVGESWKEAE